MKKTIVTPDPATEYFTGEGCHILESWNSPDDPGLSIARARVEPGIQTRLHSLHEVDERYVILSGVGLVEIGEDPPEEVSAGDLVIIPAGVPQRIANTGDSDLEFYAICTPRFTEDCYRDLG